MTEQVFSATDPDLRLVIGRDDHLDHSHVKDLGQSIQECSVRATVTNLHNHASRGHGYIYQFISEKRY